MERYYITLTYPDYRNIPNDENLRPPQLPILQDEAFQYPDEHINHIIDWNLSRPNPRAPWEQSLWGARDMRSFISDYIQDCHNIELRVAPSAGPRRNPDNQSFY